MLTLVDVETLELEVDVNAELDDGKVKVNGGCRCKRTKEIIINKYMLGEKII